MSQTEKIREAKGFVNVEFLQALGKKKKAHKEVMHNSTAMALANGKDPIVKIGSPVKEYKPKKIKE